MTTPEKFLKYIFLLLQLSLVFLYAIDFEHFDYLHQRLNAECNELYCRCKDFDEHGLGNLSRYLLLILIIIGTAVIYWLITSLV